MNVYRVQFEIEEVYTEKKTNIYKWIGQTRFFKTETKEEAEEIFNDKYEGRNVRNVVIDLFEEGVN